ncbi:UNVERIFIED_CONTAM: hypothetical protein Sradi_0200000 [Sesamum radiatum]|uniref:Uncharacterized protein n=1 Tax=Sesamum radiatum TaxID=300843 RepID=A0AAW2W3Z2_SESRA
MINDRRQPTLKELQEKKYTFPDFDMPYIYYELFRRKSIELPKSKCPDEARRFNDPKYYKYHRVVSYRIKRYFVIEEKIIALAKEGKIIINIKETTGTIIASITQANSMHVSKKKQGVKPPSTMMLSTLQFGGFEPIQIEAFFVNEEKEIVAEDDSGWILMMCR